MDTADRIICDILQKDGRTSSSEIAKALNVSVSTANERVRRLVSSGAIHCFRALLDSSQVGADFCCYAFIDMAYEGEDEAVAALCARPEVLELHHVSGPRSYLAKIRVSDAQAMQEFLQCVVKPLKAVQRTETMISLCVAKETTELLIKQAEEH